MIETLTDSNLLLYAAKHYDNVQCQDIEEFQEDLNRIKYIKKLLSKYRDKGELKHRLILNHIIVFQNVFGVEPGARMLYLKLPEYHSQLTSFLRFLRTCPPIIHSIGKDGLRIITDRVELDYSVIQKLQTETVCGED
jgi:hypothetical protein